MLISNILNRVEPTEMVELHFDPNFRRISVCCEPKLLLVRCKTLAMIKDVRVIVLQLVTAEGLKLEFKVGILTLALTLALTLP